MVFLKIALTIALIAVMVFFLSKKYNGSMVLLLIGIITLGVITLVTGESVLGQDSVGNAFIDLFEVFRSKLASNLPGSILQVMCVFGYIAFMKAIKASDMLALVCTKPLSKVKSPAVIVAGAIVLCGLIKIVLASHSSTTAMLIATLYPIMRAAGVSKETAGSAIIIGGTLDIGPSEPNTAIFLSDEFVAANAGGISTSQFFTQYQLVSGLISTAVIIILFILVNRYYDKKEGVLIEKVDASEHIKQHEAELAGTPMYYALFPLAPLALLIIFSFVDSVKLSVPVANILCFVIVFLFHLILNAKNFKESFNLSKTFFEGMGNAMVTLGCLIGASTVFSLGLTKIGGTTALLDLAAQSNFSGAASLFVVALLGMFVAFACGTGTPAMTTVLSIMPQLTATTGLGALTIAAPVIMAAGNGRALCFVAPAVLMTSAFSGINVPTFVKRNVIPALGGTVSAIIASLIFCA